MNLTFTSISDDEKITFETKAKYLNNVITFYDNNHILNKFYLDKDNNKIIIKRIGDISSDMVFIKGEKTAGTLSYNGSEFGCDLIFDCSDILISDVKIIIKYKLILSKNILNNYKIELLMH